MIFWSFGFLRMGTVGLISQALGKADYRELVYIIIRNILIAVFISILIIILKPLLLHFLNQIIVTSTETRDYIDEYISIRVFSAPAELITYVLIGFYLGIQKTFISSLLIIISSLLNIFLSIYFVTELNLDVSGIALGTLIAFYITTIIFSIYTYFLIIKRFKIIPRFNNKIIFNFKKILKLLNINFNIFIRTILLTFSFFWITYLGSTLGEEYIAINSILIQLILISSFFLDAYAFSTESIIGYSIGKKSEKMFLSSVKNSMILSFTTGLTISFLFLIYAKEIINLITDIEYLRYLSYKYLLWVIIIPPIASFCYQLDGIFIGATQTKDMRNSMIVSVVIYVILSTFLTQKLHNYGIWFSLLIFMILRASTLHLYFPKILKKFK
jgi:MATE family multidrug resistance protein